MDDEFRQKYSGKTLLSVNCNGVISHWNAITGKLQNVIHNEGNSFFTCDYSLNGLQFTVAGSDMAIHLYDELTR